MLSRKKTMPPKQIQYHVLHWPAVLAAAFCTSAACAFREVKTLGGTLDYAVMCADYGARVFSCAEYGAMVFRSAAYGATFCRSGASAITPLMAALFCEMLVSMATPLAPPPAAAT